ncbi:hypothetical protein EPJ74_11430 [Brachyspira aalborgi]|uniref:Lipoprotein n=1 Tax=Brachyspira aalborgi TaxID=29522 RepID=A0A5C8GBE9_9SPIR|nr:hypothetical protein [Brachyspira aalborgi]TXJ59119.1 hypothetical protein EPJ74_11430 [Brachyspira aalborgi]
MKVIRFILFSCLFISCIVIANLIHKNTAINRKANISDSFIYSDFISVNNNDIKSLASISFITSFDNLSKIFEIDKNLIRNNILRKNIKVKESEGEIIIFVGDNAIEQITVSVTNNIDSSLDNILNNLNSNDIRFNKEIIDNIDGNILAEIFYFKKDNYKFVITKSTNEDSNQTLTVDYINLKIL